jgi:hypothetical protein
MERQSRIWSSSSVATGGDTPLVSPHAVGPLATTITTSRDAFSLPRRGCPFKSAASST